MTHLRAVTCKLCGWVHMGVSREYAVAEVERFNAWYEQQNDEDKSLFGGPSSLALYERCFCCRVVNPPTRPSKPEDAPIGVTLQPLIVEEEA